MARRRTGIIGLHTGKTRSGKTYQLLKKLKRERRVIVWSPKERIDRYGRNWAGSVYARSIPELVQMVNDIGTGSAHIIYLPNHPKEFGDWAHCAHAFGVISQCSAVAEELASVTSPGKAPNGWHQLVTQGAGWGINIYGVTQRPAESDKTIMGNWSYCHIHQMTREQDRVYMARETDLPLEKIKALTGYHWIEKHDNGAVKTG